MLFLEQLNHLDAHFAHGVNNETQHIRLVGCNGELQTLCGATFFDWVRDSGEGNLCQDCLDDMMEFLLDQEKPKPLKLEYIDWTREKNLIRLRAYEARN